MGYILITNNSLLKDLELDTIFVEGSVEEVLIQTRDHVHKGHDLISSPIGASIRMMLSPIRSVIISSSISRSNEQSVLQLETAMEKQRMIMANRGIDIKNVEDYMRVDRELILAAISEAKNFNGGD
ncbi:MAG: GrdX family protein [Peptostreptococcaceae bacterium]|nr:GrdX family protein [Peptostreptococcaceae bacterium]